MNFNAIPVFGWFMSAFFNIAMAVPFWLTWTYLTVGERYGYFLPEVYQAPSFLDCVLVFTSVSIIKTIFIPQIVSISQSNSNSE